MLASTLYVRVVPADRDRGFILLCGYDAGVVQRTALSYTTLSNMTRESLNAGIERLRAGHSAKEVKDVTAPAVAKKLAKLFGEVPTAPRSPSRPITFSSMGIGKYLPKV